MGSNQLKFIFISIVFWSTQLSLLGALSSADPIGNTSDTDPNRNISSIVNTTFDLSETMAQNKCQKWSHSCFECVRRTDCYFCSSDQTCGQYQRRSGHRWYYRCSDMSHMYWTTCGMNLRALQTIWTLIMVTVLTMTSLFAYIGCSYVWQSRVRHLRWQQTREEQLAVLELRRAQRWQRKHQFIDKYSLNVGKDKSYIRFE